MKKLIAFIALALCASFLAAGTATSATAAAPKETKVAQRMHVGTYNVCAVNCPGLKAWKTRVTGVVSTIKKANLDIVAVQEGGGYNTSQSNLLKSKMKAAGYELANGSSSRYLFFNPKTYTITDPKTKKNTFYKNYLVDSTVPGTNPKVMPMREFINKATGARFLVINYHLTALDVAKMDLARSREYIWTEEWAAENYTKKNPGVTTLRVGDFNSYYQSRTKAVDSHWNRFRVWDKMKAQGGICDSAARSLADSGRKYNSINPAPGDKRKFGTARHLDHVWLPCASTVHKFYLYNRKVAYKNQYSDHDMVSAVFTAPTVKYS